MAVSRSYPRHLVIFREAFRFLFCHFDYHRLSQITKGYHWFIFRSFFPFTSSVALVAMSQGFPKVPKGSQRFPKIPKGSQRFPKVPQDSPRFPKVLQGSPRFSKVPPKLPKVPQSSPRFPKSVDYFLLFFLFWLTTILSHPMAVYGANEIRTFIKTFV